MFFPPGYSQVPYSTVPGALVRYSTVELPGYCTVQSSLTSNFELYSSTNYCTTVRRPCTVMLAIKASVPQTRYRVRGDVVPGTLSHPHVLSTLKENAGNRRRQVGDNKAIPAIAPAATWTMYSKCSIDDFGFTTQNTGVVFLLFVCLRLETTPFVFSSLFKVHVTT